MSELRVAVVNRFFFYCFFLVYVFSIGLNTENMGREMKLQTVCTIFSERKMVSALCSSAGCAVKSGNCMPAHSCRSYLRRLISGYMHLWQFVNSVVRCCQWKREHQTPSSAFEIISLFFLNSRDLIPSESRIQIQYKTDVSLV